MRVASSMLSRRSNFSAEANAHALHLAHARASGRKLVDLTRSNPTDVGILADTVALGEALRAACDAPYRPEAMGLQAAREAVAAELALSGQTVDPDHVVITASTSEAYSFALKLLTDAGDRIWAPRPSYPLLEHLTQLEQVELLTSPLEYDGVWHYPAMDRDALTGARGLFVVNPNNPTGNYLKRDELRSLCELELPIVSDEVFSAFALTTDGARAGSVLESSAPLSLLLGGLSKYVGLPQLKLAWMVLGGEPSALRAARERLEVIADAFLSVATPVQLALPSILKLGRSTREALAQRCRANYHALLAMAEGAALTVLPVEGGWYACLHLPGTRTDDAWVRLFLERHDVVVQPGWLYDFARSNYAVVSLITPETELRAGFERILEAVARGDA